MRWPSGSPNASVLGELGWLEAEALMLRRAAGLFGRLRCLPTAGQLQHTALEMFNFARGRDAPCASWAERAFAGTGIPGEQLRWARTVSFSTAALVVLSSGAKPAEFQRK